MRRTVLTMLVLAALAAPAAAVAAPSVATADGILVVKNGQAPYFPQLALAKSTPVVQLKITGAVIGQVTDGGMIIIDPGPNPLNPPEVTGAGSASQSSKSDTAQIWKAPNNGFKFRAVGGTFTIVIYGSGVNLVAVGTGQVVLAGNPDDPTDGWYALNGGLRHSMPGQPIKQLILGDDSSS